MKARGDRDQRGVVKLWVMWGSCVWGSHFGGLVSRMTGLKRILGMNAWLKSRGRGGRRRKKVRNEGWTKDKVVMAVPLP